jgi:hypothetical protein
MSYRVEGEEQANRGVKRPKDWFLLFYYFLGDRDCFAVQKKKIQNMVQKGKGKNQNQENRKSKKKSHSFYLFHQTWNTVALHQTDTRTKRDVSTWPNSTAGHGGIDDLRGRTSFYVDSLLDSYL